MKKQANTTSEELIVRRTYSPTGCFLYESIVQELVKCENCKYGNHVNSAYICEKQHGFATAHEPGWFCADGKEL